MTPETTTRTPTSAQRRAAAQWAGAWLPGNPPAELRRVLAGLEQHPDAYAPGYSLAKRARQRLADYLNRLEALPPSPARPRPAAPRTTLSLT